LVEVSAQTKVPMAYVKDGEIVLNLNYSATKDLQFTNEAVTFSARFSGVSNNLYVPIAAVKGIFARENGQGMFFEVQSEDEDVVKEIKNKEISNKEKNISPEVKKTTLKLVK
jgi:stringent starvation protein B